MRGEADFRLVRETNWLACPRRHLAAAKLLCLAEMTQWELQDVYHT